jgi:hypothetical protein
MDVACGQWHFILEGKVMKRVLLVLAVVGLFCAVAPSMAVAQVRGAWRRPYGVYYAPYATYSYYTPYAGYYAPYTYYRPYTSYYYSPYSYAPAYTTYYYPTYPSTFYTSRYPTYYSGSYGPRYYYGGYVGMGWW